MKNRPSASYSHLMIMKCAFEYELNNVLKFEDRQEVFRIIEYFHNRLDEIKQDEKAILKEQAR